MGPFGASIHVRSPDSAHPFGSALVQPHRRHAGVLEGRAGARAHRGGRLHRCGRRRVGRRSGDAGREPRAAIDTCSAGRGRSGRLRRGGTAGRVGRRSGADRGRSAWRGRDGGPAQERRGQVAQGAVPGQRHDAHGHRQSRVRPRRVPGRARIQRPGRIRRPDPHRQAGYPEVARAGRSRLLRRVRLRAVQVENRWHLSRAQRGGTGTQGRRRDHQEDVRRQAERHVQDGAARDHRRLHGADVRPREVRFGSRVASARHRQGLVGHVVQGEWHDVQRHRQRRVRPRGLRRHLRDRPRRRPQVLGHDGASRGA